MLARGTPLSIPKRAAPTSISFAVRATTRQASAGAGRPPAANSIDFFTGTGRKVQASISGLNPPDRDRFD